jgi:hypothetical protein
VQHLDDYFSEYALIRYRVLVEVEYFLFLGKKKFFSLNAAARRQLQTAMEQFSLEDALWIKEKEKTTNHDVKAVEYFLKDRLEGQVRDKLAGPASHAAASMANGSTSGSLPRISIIPPFPCCGNMPWNSNIFPDCST